MTNQTKMGWNLASVIPETWEKQFSNGIKAIIREDVAPNPQHLWWAKIWVVNDQVIADFETNDLEFAKTSADRIVQTFENDYWHLEEQLAKWE